MRYLGSVGILRIYFIGLTKLTFTRITKDSGIYFHWSPKYCILSPNPKRPKIFQWDWTEPRTIERRFQMHSCGLVQGAILNGRSYFQYSKPSGFHFREFRPTQPVLYCWLFSPTKTFSWFLLQSEFSLPFCLLRWDQSAHIVILRTLLGLHAGSVQKPNFNKPSITNR